MAWCRGILSSETVTWHSFQCCCLHCMWHWTCRPRWRRRSGGAQHTQRRTVSFGVGEITHIKKQNKKHPNQARVKFSIPLPIALDAIADRKRLTHFRTTLGHLWGQIISAGVKFGLFSVAHWKRINTTRGWKFGFYSFHYFSDTKKNCEILECDDLLSCFTNRLTNLLTIIVVFSVFDSINLVRFAQIRVPVKPPHNTPKMQMHHNR